MIKNSSLLLLFVFLVINPACQNPKEQVAAQTDLFQKEYLSAVSLLNEAEKDRQSWKALSTQLKEHPEFKKENPEILRLEKDLNRFYSKLESYRNELKNWHNLTNDFSTMQSKNVKKMSDMRLKSVKSIKENIKKIHGTGNRIYGKASQKYSES